MKNYPKEEPQIIWLLVFERDEPGEGGSDVEVFSGRDEAGKFARENFRFNNEANDNDTGGATAVPGKMFPDQDEEYAPSGIVHIYSSFIR